jgi:hypothetical protein
MVRLEVLTATSMKMSVLWDVAPCSVVDTDGLPEEPTAPIIWVMS